MFQRIKGAIDSRIAEEQARQRAAAQSVSPSASASPSRSGSVSARRSLSSNPSSSKRPKPVEKSNLLTDKAPEPHEFDPELAIEDESSNNGASNDNEPPKNGEGKELEPGVPNASVPNISTTTEKGEAATTARRSGELPTELRVKLRKLERLEGKYQELLAAYRIAHARAQTIGPFEASLRENTPLTSIGDPGALVEYLNQLTLKSEMALDELKRVAAERDDYRKKFDRSEIQMQALKDEVSELKQQMRHSDPPAYQLASPQQLGDLPDPTDSLSPTDIGSVPTMKPSTPSLSSRIPSFALFSPKNKAVKSPQGEEEYHEFFSYDNELSRLETELQERRTENADLKKQVSVLEGDLSIARESTESMVQSLETATRELHALREASEKHGSARNGLQIKVEGLEQEISALRSLHTTVKQENSSLESQISGLKAMLEEKERVLSSINHSEQEKNSQLCALERETLELREKVAQKNAIAKDLEDSLAMAILAEKQQAQQFHLESASQKQIGILNNIMESLRSQLRNAEGEIMELKETKRKAEIKINDLLELNAHNDSQEGAQSRVTDEALDRHVAHMAEQPSTRYFGFVNDEEFSLSGDTSNALRQLSKKLKDTRPELYEAMIYLEKSKDDSLAPSEASVASHGRAGKGKKKKKKNKRVGLDPGVANTIHDPPAKVTETLHESEDQSRRPNVLLLATQEDLEQRIQDLESRIQEKDATIDRLAARLKDQDALNEEIGILRDDLLHQGEGHVEAREALTAARCEKFALEEHVAAVEKELSDLKAHSACSSVECRKAYEDLKTESGVLRRDLEAAEHIAASRFKDNTDLRELLSKAQLELNKICSEVGELRPAKEDLKNKIGELRRLEARHEELKADMKNLSRKMGEKDAEVKDLRQKLADGSSAKIRLEEDLRAVRSALEDAQATKQAALDSQKQTSEELSRVKADFNIYRSKTREMEEEVVKHVKEVESVKEEISVKTSLYNSAQAIISGLREQMLELSTQAREASGRAESLEEELAEAQRMLSERSREGETMRRLLADLEERTSTKIIEMKERMDTAIEERDRMEDEASVTSRRMAREIEGLRNKSKETARSLKALEEENEQLERSLRDLKRRRDESEAAEERARAEFGEVQSALQQMREALDQRERESMELERQKADAKVILQEMQERLERLQQTNKGLTDELKSIQQQRRSLRPATKVDSEVQASRSSLDSADQNAHDGLVVGPSANVRDRVPVCRSSTPTGPRVSTIDYVYLKNVLLQFLEQKDKTHQKQLIPVLGMLLNFDRKDEQKWMAAIASK